MASAANDEILGADLSINTPIPSRNRHAIKKAPNPNLNPNPNPNPAGERHGGGGSDA